MGGEARCYLACDFAVLFWEEKRERRSLCIRNGKGLENTHFDVISRERSVVTEAVYSSLWIPIKTYLIMVASMASHHRTNITSTYFYLSSICTETFPRNQSPSITSILLVKSPHSSLQAVFGLSYLCGVYKDFDQLFYPTG